MWPASPGFALSLLSDLERFRDEVDFYFGSSAGQGRGTATFPPLSVEETGEDFRVSAFAPGFAAADFDITIQNTILTVRGARRPSVANNGSSTTCHRKERLFGEFTRVVTLPDSVDPTQVHATYTNGVLTVFVGKRTEVKPRKIELKAQ